MQAVQEQCLEQEHSARTQQESAVGASCFWHKCVQFQARGRRSSPLHSTSKNTIIQIYNNNKKFSKILLRWNKCVQFQASQLQNTKLQIHWTWWLNTTGRYAPSKVQCAIDIETIRCKYLCAFCPALCSGLYFSSVQFLGFLMILKCPSCDFSNCVF